MLRFLSRIEAVKPFENMDHHFRSNDMQDNAQRFSKARFMEAFQEVVNAVEK
jgi:hypothetical protein